MAHRRGPWSQGEDAYLVQLVSTQGALNWVRIAQLIGSRSPKQCRERYHQNLKPSLNHEPITAEEGVLIERLVGEMGKRWAEIARRLHGRSDNAVKNWWNGSMNRRRRSVLRSRQSPSSQEAYGGGRRQALLPPTRAPGPFVRPLNISSTSYSSGRIDSGLPSPCESVVSRAESLEGPPSLVSDTGSVYSASPHIMASPNVALPPLETLARMDRRTSLPMLYSEAQPTTYRAGYEPKTPYVILPGSNTAITTTYLRPEQHVTVNNTFYSSRARPPTPSLAEVQLPPLQMSSREAFGERDSRMKLSMLLD